MNKAKEFLDRKLGSTEYIKSQYLMTRKELEKWLEEYAEPVNKNDLLAVVSNQRELLIAFKAYQNGRATKPNENDTHYVDSYLDWEKSNL